MRGDKKNKRREKLHLLHNFLLFFYETRTNINSLWLVIHPRFEIEKKRKGWGREHVIQAQQIQRIGAKKGIKGLKGKIAKASRKRAKFVALRSNSRSTRGHRRYSTKLIESSGSTIPSDILLGLPVKHSYHSRDFDGFLGSINTLARFAERRFKFTFKFYCNTIHTRNVRNKAASVPLHVWCPITLMTINEKVSDGEKVMGNGAYVILASLLLLSNFFFILVLNAYLSR